MRHVLTALAITLTTSTNLSEAAQIEKIKVGNWEGGAYTDDKTNSFLSCTVGTNYVNGTYLNISAIAEGGTGIGVFSPNLKLQVGELITGTLKIDERYFNRFDGRAISENGISIVFAETDIVFDALRRGRTLTLTTTFGTAFYDLKDTAKALSEIKRCADKYRPFARKNNALNSWLTRNSWFSDPKYSALSEAAQSIRTQLIAEGKDYFSSDFYDELDKRLLALASSNEDAKSTTAGAMGTGIVMTATGEVLTNLHVIKNCVSPIEVRGENGVTTTTTVLLTDPQNDLALLQTSYKPTKIPRVRDTRVKTGESVAVIGFPLATYDLTITEGIVSSLSGGGDSSLMTISAPANQGNSGGPVLDTNGLIVGVLTASQNDAQNTNYAVKSSAVRNFLSRRISYTPPRRQPSPPMSFTELAEHANWFTVRLLCRTDNTGE